MPKGGRRPGAGRPKGSKSRQTLAREQIERALADSELTPLEFMLQVMRDEKANWDDRKWAAQNAAPYCHARLAAASLELENNDRMSHDEWILKICEESERTPMVELDPEEIAKGNIPNLRS